MRQADWIGHTPQERLVVWAATPTAAGSAIPTDGATRLDAGQTWRLRRWWRALKGSTITPSRPLAVAGQWLPPS